MSQHPSDPGARRTPWNPGRPPQPRERPRRTPGPPDLRLLLTLTVVSFVLGVVGSVVGIVATPQQVAGTPAETALGPGFLAGSLVVGVGVTAGLYALVYFPLRERRQWGWVLGVVFASMAVLGTVLNLVLLVVLPGGLSPTLLTGVLKTVVDIAWLVVALRPGVRAVLR